MTQSEIQKVITLPENVTPSTVQKEKLVEQWMGDVGYVGINPPESKTETDKLFNMAKEYYQVVYG